MDNSHPTYEQVSHQLEIRAKTGQVVTYNDFALKLGLGRVNNRFSNHPLKLYFEQLDGWDHFEGKPFRTALVVLKKTGRPGKGFYKSLSELRGMVISPEDEEKIWRSEIESLMQHYTNQRLEPHDDQGAEDLASVRAKETIPDAGGWIEHSEVVRRMTKLLGKRV